MLILQGIQGLGKTFIYVMLKKLIHYVKTIDTTLLEHHYNDFMEGTILIILEELKISGSNRKRIQNQLKPLITNEFISINKKYVSEYNTQNFANMIAFTNESNPISIDEGDRRYFIVSNKIRNIKDIPNVYGCDYNNEKNTTVQNVELYFKELFSAIEQHPNALVKYFHSVDTSEIEGLNRSPMNESKKVMIESEKENIDGYTEFNNFIDTNDNPYINKKVVIASKFRDEMVGKISKPNPSNMHFKNILTASGFYYYDRKRFKGRDSIKETIYLHNSLPEGEIYKVLEDVRKAFNEDDKVK